MTQSLVQRQKLKKRNETKAKRSNTFQGGKVLSEILAHRVQAVYPFVTFSLIVCKEGIHNAVLGSQNETFYRGRWVSVLILKICMIGVPVGLPSSSPPLIFCIETCSLNV